MKKKMSFQLSYTLFLIAVLFACTFVQTSCSNAGGQPNQQKSNNWIIMDITFKPNTSEETIDKAIRAIGKMWIKSAAPYMNKYPNLHPTITITSLENLRYRMSLLSTSFAKSASGDYTSVQTLSIGTPCPPCPGPCAACDSTGGRTSATYSIAKMTFEPVK